MCYTSLKSNWTKHRKAFTFPEKKNSRNGAQKISSLRPSKYEPRHDKTNKVTVRQAKTQISLGIRPV